MQRFRKIADVVLMPVPAAVGFFIGGVVVFLIGFLWTQTPHDLFKLVEQGYSNFGIELVSIALTVIVIDRLNQRRSDRERLQELITQLHSRDNGLTLAALEIMRLKGWIKDGSLRMLSLYEANFAGANLESAELEGISLQATNLADTRLDKANLTNANLARAYLSGASLWKANLVGVVLWSANLEGANLQRSNLAGAKLYDANLADAYLHEATLSESTILPDGAHWTPETDMTRFTDPNHPNFWRSDNPKSPAYRGD